MANEKFNWKRLFIQEEENPTPSSKPVAENTGSDSKLTFPPTQNNTGVTNEVLSKVIDMYEKGFDSLNQSGYDFYEFFKSVMATDPNNPQSYVMAYTMASNMDKSIDKSFLLNSADFYQKEVLKVYVKFDTEGRKAKSDLLISQKNEKESLQTDVKNIQNKIMVLQKELEQKSALLQNYDANNFGKLQALDQKILANELSKDRIIQKITQVISGINNHI